MNGITEFLLKKEEIVKEEPKLEDSRISLILAKFKERAKAKEMEEIQKQEDEKPKTYITHPVVGVTFEGRQTILEKYLEEYRNTGKQRKCELVPEPDNKYDKNAVAVYIEGNSCKERIGYIAKDLNQELKSTFDSILEVRVHSIGRTDNGNIGLSITLTIG